MTTTPRHATAGRHVRRATARAGRAPARRGFALVDAIIGGVILAIGLAALLSLSARALSMQQQGEVEIVGAHLVDEILSTVLTEGPQDFRDLYDTFGRFDEPFGNYEYEVSLDDRGIGMPWRVVATVRHVQTGATFSAESMIADRGGTEPNPARAPTEPIDRQARYEEKNDPNP